MTFLEHLAGQGIITDNQISEVIRLAEEKHGGNIDDMLVELGLDDKKLLELKGSFFNVPTKDVDLRQITSDTLKYIPEDSAKHYMFVPLGIKDGVLEVGIVNPDNIGAIDAIQFITSKMNIPYKIFLISSKAFEGILKNYEGLTGEVDQAISEIDKEIESVNTSDIVIEDRNIQAKLKPGEEERIVEDAPIIKVVAVILRHATEGNASDIHIENTGDKVKVRFRVDGVLHISLVLPLNVYAGIVARIKIMAKLRLDEKRKPQDGSFATKIAGRKVEFRVSTFPAYYGEKVVMRILDSSRGVKKLSELGLSEHNYKLIKEALAKPYGLILMTGPTGSGKSTTVYSMLNELDKEKSNVVSLEDPVEYQIPDVNQSQVMPEIGYSFASGLRSILRQDPNIIMVGEIRDKETAQLAIQAALTGHLVLSTLHTNSAVGVVPRLVDMGVDPYLIAPTLILSIAQRLARVVCEDSRKEVPMDETMKELLDNQFKDLPEKYRGQLPARDKMYEVVPSAECPNGTRGRMAVFEMFAVSKEMQHVILTSPVEAEIYKVARADGMLTMKEDAIIKSLKGELPFQEIYNDL
ncbi:MAG: type II/IV secretion system protein [Candidatus Pacebacteria bacterium]|nr:type II/IV secretion system protein [Candidatus Paceibacterota bacterium]MBP9772933.1 type II/IV secretion system protein [Candidatus Paceibacterota bacterium]